MRRIPFFTHTTRRTVLASLALAALSWSPAGPAQHIATPWKKAKAGRAEEIRGPQQPVIGAPAAPVTIVSFSDYQCPYCRQLSGTLDGLLEDYPGQVRVIYRHLATNTESRAIATAALCASEQGQFARYHQLVFGTPGVQPDSLVSLAERLALDAQALQECIASNRYAARIDGDVREAERLGIQVTPTMFVNGVRIVGAASAEKLRARIEQLLAATPGADGR